MGRSEESYGETPEATCEGAGFYRTSVLRHYDWWVHGVSNALIWRVPTGELTQLYRQNMTACHLEVGVGTGKFLSKALSREWGGELLLVDGSHDCLEWATRRLKRQGIQVASSLQVDLSSPASTMIALEPKFQSAGLNYVLHCLSGQTAKDRAVQFVRRRLCPTGALFGSTLIGTPSTPFLPARWLETRYQNLGIFNNQNDSVESVRQLFDNHFEDVSCRQYGRAVFFRAAIPKAD